MSRFNFDDEFHQFFGSRDPFEQFRSQESGSGSGSGRRSAPGPQKGPPIKWSLPCSLEDLYKGAITKKIKISRKVFGSTVDEIVEIEIKPGMKKGTKVIFSRKGNEDQYMIPSDVVVTIDEKPHSLFKRDNNDLVMTQKISVAEALTGCVVELSTLDGRSLTIPINHVVHPNYRHVVKGEGMPVPNDSTKKGDLKIKFDIRFPKRLDLEQKALIKRALRCNED